MRTFHNLTIYNRYVTAGVEYYQRAEVRNVKWENRKAANVIRSGLLAADSVAVYIPSLSRVGYLAPKTWQALSNKAGYWTLQEGDVMVKGIVTDEITSVFTVTKLKAKYDDVVSIKSVDTMDTGSPSMQHWQVGAS